MAGPTFKKKKNETNLERNKENKPAQVNVLVSFSQIVIVAKEEAKVERHTERNT